MRVLKFFFIFRNCFILYERLLNLHKQQKNSFICTLFSLMLSVIVHVTISHVHSAYFFMTFPFFVLIVLIRYRCPLRTTISASILSFGISYISFIVATILVMPFGILLIMLPISYQTEELILVFFAGLLQSYLVTAPFLINRFKRGMPFLKKMSLNNSGIVISLLFLLISSLFISDPSPDVRFVFYLSVVLISGLLIFLWWFRCLTQSYADSLRKRELDQLNLQIEQLKNDNALLEQENNRLAKIIHKDNKLIPALELAVQEALHSFERSDKASKETASELLSQLKNLSRERYGIITAYERETKSLPQTGVVCIDAIIHYIAQKAALLSTDFDFVLNCDLKAMIASTIQENDLSSLLADLLENALIATKYSPIKKILLCMCLSDQHYRIDVYDSGIPFCEDTILQLGKRQTTTHPDTGGSGIGMMSIFQIKDAHYASLILDECIPGNLYTKDLAVCFDNLGQFRLKSSRINFSAKDCRPNGITII